MNLIHIYPIHIYPYLQIFFIQVNLFFFFLQIILLPVYFFIYIKKETDARAKPFFMLFFFFLFFSLVLFYTLKTFIKFINFSILTRSLDIIIIFYLNFNNVFLIIMYLILISIINCSWKFNSSVFYSLNRFLTWFYYIYDV
jgi:hypothetical protein